MHFKCFLQYKRAERFRWIRNPITYGQIVAILDEEKELNELNKKLKDVKRYEVVFESASQATLQIAIVLQTGTVLIHSSLVKAYK